MQVERLVPADPSVWWFRGLRWAQPSREHLTRLMRHVFTHRDEAAAKVSWCACGLCMAKTRVQKLVCPCPMACTTKHALIGSLCEDAQSPHNLP